MPPGRAIAAVLALACALAVGMALPAGAAGGGDRHRVVYLIEEIIGLQEELDDLAGRAAGPGDAVVIGQLADLRDQAWDALREMVEAAAGPAAADQLPERLPRDADGEAALREAAGRWAAATMAPDEAGEFMAEVDDAINGTTDTQLRELVQEAGEGGLGLAVGDAGGYWPELDLERLRELARQAEQAVEAARAEVERVQGLPDVPLEPGAERYDEEADKAAISALDEAEVQALALRALVSSREGAAPPAEQAEQAEAAEEGGDTGTKEGTDETPSDTDSDSDSQPTSNQASTVDSCGELCGAGVLTQPGWREPPAPPVKVPCPLAPAGCDPGGGVTTTWPDDWPDDWLGGWTGGWTGDWPDLPEPPGLPGLPGGTPDMPTAPVWAPSSVWFQAG